MPIRFEHVTLGQRVLFGSGRATTHVLDEVVRLGARRVLLIASPSHRALSDDISAGIPSPTRFEDVVEHVPLEVANRARAAAAGAEAELIVSVGGGSATGLAKAVALTTGIPVVAVPTTYAGSEATNVWGITEGARKKTGTDDRVLPATVVYDAELTLGLPVGLSVASGLNAVAHCVDSLWAPRTDPINQAIGFEAVRALSAGLRGVYRGPGDLDAREQVLYGSYLAAVAFASAGSGMHHKICHVLGGAYNLPHAQMHAIVLPYVLAYNIGAVPELGVRLAEAFQSSSAVEGLDGLRTELDAPRALRDIGFSEESIPDAARLCAEAVPTSNPRPVNEPQIESLLRAAWAGTPPSDLSTKGA